MQVWVHQVDLAAACAESGVTPTGVGGAVPSTPTAPEAWLADATTDTRATLVLAVAHGLVAAVLLQPFEPCVDMQVAGVWFTHTKHVEMYTCLHTSVGHLMAPTPSMPWLHFSILASSRQG